MKFIVDESTGMSVVEFLRSEGYDVLAVSETMRKANDQTVLSKARSTQRILVTNDKNFGELIFRSGQLHHGVLLLRLHNERPSNCIRVIKAVLEKHSHLLKNHFSVATDTEVRIRPIKETS